MEPTQTDEAWAALLRADALADTAREERDGAEEFQRIAAASAQLANRVNGPSRVSATTKARAAAAYSLKSAGRKLDVRLQASAASWRRLTRRE